MTEIIKIENTSEGSVVSAKELHQFLEIQTPFHKWIPRMFDYGFTENVDYQRLDKNVQMPNGATREALEDYALTLNCAKEISMIQRSEKGKIARQYFIECEKQLKEVRANKKELREPSENEIKIKLMEAEAKLLAEKRLTLEMVTNQVHKEILFSKFYSDEKHLLPLPEVGEKSYSATELSTMIQKKYGLNLSANKIGRIANENGLKTSENGIFLYDKSKYSEKTVESFKYYERCMDKIVSLFKKERKKSKSDSIIF